MASSSFSLGYAECRDTLRQRLAEPAPTRIQLLSGPRQVGKTTLLLELAASLGERACYAAADSPEAGLAGFWERLWTRAEEVAARGQAVVLLDEIQYLEDWSRRLKAEWDRVRRRRRSIHVVATGSSALRLWSGASESLAGRFERLTLRHWSARELAGLFGPAAHQAAEMVVRMGAYPGAFPLREDVPRWTAYVRDAIIEPAIGRDILTMTDVRRPALLRQVFAVCASAPAQIMALQKLRGELQDAGALETVAHYLALLRDAFLVAPLEKYATRPARRRAAPPKLVTLSNALLAAGDPRGIPDRVADPARFGAWVENACIAQACNAGQQVSYWREEPLDVDAVIDGDRGRWAVEIKTGPFEVNALRGLLEFTRRFPSFRPLVLCEPLDHAAAERAGVASMDWRDFLLDGPRA